MALKSGGTLYATGNTMKHLQHIERSAFRRGEYIAYFWGALRVRRSANGWETYSLASQSGEFVRISAPTLAEMDTRITEMLANRRRAAAWPILGF